MAVPAWIAQINRKLKACSVIQKPGRDVLYLRATLPNKKDPGKNCQQAISTGLKESSADHSEVQQMAFRLDDEIVNGTFSWSGWTKEKLAKPVNDRSVISFAELAQAIEESFDAKYPDKSKKGRGVYTSKFKPAINRIKLLSGTADMESICSVVASIESASSRKNTGSIISGAIDHLSLGWDKKPLFTASSGYTKAHLTEKDIPQDEEMLAIWKSIPDLRWKWVHGMVMAFGCRPSELLSAEFEDGIVNLTTYKTKGEPYPREAWALPDEWIKELKLKKIHLPPGDRLDISAQYANYMDRNGLKYWPLYNLRHAYAIRCLVQGIEVGLAARLMGHSVDMHRQHYQRWINKNHMKALRDLQKEKFKRG